MSIYALPKQNEVTVAVSGEYVEIAEVHDNGTVSVVNVSLSCVGPLARTLTKLSDEFIKKQK